LKRMTKRPGKYNRADIFSEIAALPVISLRVDATTRAYHTLT
jgi:hypothetical protein